MTGRGRPRLGKEKKKPSDYPQMAFRVSGDVKTKLEGLIEEAQIHLNRLRPEGAPAWCKNDVIISALLAGLKHLSDKTKK